MEGTRADLVFGSNAQLRAVAEVYGSFGRAGQIHHGLRRSLDARDDPGSF
jgi:hypothetical protein